jgi:hypothetical protein
VLHNLIDASVIIMIYQLVQSGAARLGWTAPLRRAVGLTQGAEVCQCGHVSSMHDKGGCHAQEEIATQWNEYGKSVAYGWQGCNCVHYVGPLSSYVPEVDGTDSRPAIEAEESEE